MESETRQKLYDVIADGEVQKSLTPDQVLRLPGEVAVKDGSSWVPIESHPDFAVFFSSAQMEVRPEPDRVKRKSVEIEPEIPEADCEPTDGKGIASDVGAIPKKDESAEKVDRNGRAKIGEAIYRTGHVLGLLSAGWIIIQWLLMPEEKMSVAWWGYASGAAASFGSITLFGLAVSYIVNPLTSPTKKLTGYVSLPGFACVFWYSFLIGKELFEKAGLIAVVYGTVVLGPIAVVLFLVVYLLCGMVVYFYHKVIAK